jgi:putative tricarboxylic transport membrane protein
MHKANLISGITLLVFGIALALVIIPLQIEESTDATISPRLLPQICAWALIFLSALLVVNTVRHQPLVKQYSPISLAELGAMFAISAVFVVGIILFHYTGPLWSSAVLVVVPMLLMGERRPVLLVAIPACLILAAYGLIYQVLGTSIQ